MRGRTVISVSANNDEGEVTPPFPFSVLGVRHTSSIPKMDNVGLLRLAPLPEWSIPNAVAVRGCLLRDALRKHPGIAAVLDSLGTAPPGTKAPLYVKLSEGDAELIAWETLCDMSDRFVALDARWPIGRITDPTTTIQRQSPLFRMPVKIMAIISAHGIAGQEREWEVLRDSVDAARQAGLGVEVRVLTGDVAVHALVTSDIAASRPWVSVAGLEGSSAKVLTAMRMWQPNIVHFFCHGRADSGLQQLELATASDFNDPSVLQGSVVITAEQLAESGSRLDNPWLIVLNCCEGARASHKALSLAHRVVSRAFPAAFAMLEPVDANDAHEFTLAIYGALLTELRSVKTKLDAGQPVYIEWASLTHDARDALNSLHQSNASVRREWALPAFYVRGMDAVQFRAAPQNIDETQFASWMATRDFATYSNNLLRNSGLSEERCSKAVTDLLTKGGLPRSLWPSLDGTF